MDPSTESLIKNLADLVPASDSPEDVRAALVGLDALRPVTDPWAPAFVGAVRGLQVRYPESPAWDLAPGPELAETAAAILAPGTEPPSHWALLYAANWLFACPADNVHLIELCRLARHRDGSTATLIASLEAGTVLRALSALPIASAALEAAGWSEDAPVGNYPDVQSMVAAPAPAPAPAAAASPAAAPAPPAPAPAPVRPEGPLGVWYSLESGEVIFNNARFSVADAITVTEGLIRATRALLLPAEGYAWLDDTFDPLGSSSLLVLDPYLQGGLPKHSEDGAFGDGSEPAAIKATVKQHPSGTSYAAVLNLRGGGTRDLGASFPSIQTAKVAVARAVRAEAPAAS